MIKRKLIRILCFSLLITNLSGVHVIQANTEKQTLNQKDRNLELWYETAANINSKGGSGQDWERETLPIGNGNMGGLVFGGISKERVHFNDKTLWTGGPSTSRPNYDGGNRDTNVTDTELNTFRKELDDKSQTVFNHGMESNRYAGDLNGMGSYQDFGDMYFDFSVGGLQDKNINNYIRNLDLKTAIASTSFTAKDVTYHREYFASYPDQVIVMKYTADKKGSITFDAEMKLNNSGLKGTWNTNEEQGTIAIDGVVNDNGLQFNSTMKIVPVNGTMIAHDNKITIQNADEVYVYMSSKTDYKNDYPTYRDAQINPSQVVMDRINHAAENGYELTKQTHLADYQNLFQRVDLSLGEAAPNMPTDELVKAYRDQAYSTYLEELIFQYGRYMTIASSRGDLPSNLCGLWTIGSPAWNGDYHFNVNVQMNYWPVYVTNLKECGDTFVEYMDNLREPGRVTAARSHGVVSKDGEENGFVVHTQNNPFGMCAPSADQEYGWNVTGAAWAMQNVYDGYRFTQDVSDLRDKIYPMLKEQAKFWDAYLWYSPTQERLVVAPSFSAEHGPTVNGATYDQSLVWELYKEAIEAAEILAVDADLVATWKEKQAQLNPIIIGSDGEVKEWFEQITYGKAKAGSLAEVNIPNFYAGNSGEHRHSSHLIGLYPGTLINKDNTDYMQAAKVSLLQRGFEATGWSKAHKINMWARTGDGNNTLKLIRSMIAGGNTGILENLFDSHGGGANNKGYSIFQIDGNFGLTSGIAEMLIQSQLDYVQFLPSLPDAWNNGSVDGLVARGNFTIGEEWKNGLADKFTVQYTGEDDTAVFEGEYQNIKHAQIYKDESVFDGVEYPAGNNRIRFTAQKGSVYTIVMNQWDNEILKEKAKNLLTTMEPDLRLLKEELATALEENAKELQDIVQKADLANSLYKMMVPYTESMYQLSMQNGLSRDEVYDIMHVIMETKNVLTQNEGTYEEYLTLQANVKEVTANIHNQLKNNVISFSKDNGVITTTDHTITLSKHAEVNDAIIRYVIDETGSGILPTNDAQEYTKPIVLSLEKDTMIRAALYKGEQRISEVFTRSYSAKSVAITSMTTDLENWGSQYNNEKLFDGNVNTR